MSMLTAHCSLQQMPDKQRTMNRMHYTASTAATHKIILIRIRALFNMFNNNNVVMSTTKTTTKSRNEFPFHRLVYKHFPCVSSSLALFDLDSVHSSVNFISIWIISSLNIYLQRFSGVCSSMNEWFSFTSFPIQRGAIVFIRMPKQ